jgi:hypothetical protein
MVDFLCRLIAVLLEAFVRSKDGSLELSVTTLLQFVLAVERRILCVRVAVLAVDDRPCGGTCPRLGVVGCKVDETLFGGVRSLSRHFPHCLPVVHRGTARDSFCSRVPLVHLDELVTVPLVWISLPLTAWKTKTSSIETNEPVGVGC